MQISLTRPSDKDTPVRAAWGRGKVAWGGVGLSRVEYHGTDAQASLGRVGPARAAWGRGKVAWGGVGLSRVEYHGTDAEASLTSGRRPSGVGGYIHIYLRTWQHSNHSCAEVCTKGPIWLVHSVSSSQASSCCCSLSSSRCSSSSS